MDDHDQRRSSKGRWVDGTLIPDDPFLRSECEKRGLTGFRFEDGRLSLREFAVTIDGIPMVGDIPYPSIHRTDSPKKAPDLPSEYAVGTGVVDSEFSPESVRLPKVYVNGSNDDPLVISRESMANGGDRIAVRPMSFASNYNQALASMSRDLGWSQRDMRAILRISRSGPGEDIDELRGISERNGIPIDTLSKIVSRPLTVHEEIFTDEHGKEHAVGVLVDRELHESIHHKGMVSEMRSRNDLDSLFEQAVKDSRENLDPTDVEMRQDTIEKLFEEADSAGSSERMELDDSLFEANGPDLNGISDDVGQSLETARDISNSM